MRPGLTKEQFISELLSGLTTPPSYFPKNVLMNIQGYDTIDTVLERGKKALSPDAFELIANETGALIIDTRKAADFASGFIPNSINIGHNGTFAVWVGTLVPDIKQEILIVAEKGREEEAITRLARVGYDHAIGFLDGGFEAWKNAGKEIDTIKTISVSEFIEAKNADNKIAILDVRKKSEFDSEHIVEAENMPLDYINDYFTAIDKQKTYYVHCAGGYRSMIFASILRARGYNNLIDVDGGFNAIKASGKFNITDYVCPTTML